jgi:hydroxypyruvate isomerase
VPGYHLRTVEHALATIAAVARPNLRLMFDCYHVQVEQGDVTRRLAAALPLTGHIQIAGAPARGRPDRGELNLGFVLAEARRLGWTGFVGAEYRPDGPTEDSLDWRTALAASPV